MTRRFAIFVCLALLGAACGSSTDPVSTGAVANQPSDGIARCDQLATHPTAEPEWYRDTPRYVGNEQPTVAVRTWAGTRPGFQEIWIDRDHNGWIAVGFDRDVALRQQEILQQFPDDGVVAVLVDWNLAELRLLQDEIGQHLVSEGVNSFAIGASTQQGLVQISLGVLTDDRLAALEPYIDEPICVEGLDPDGAILDGPQLEAGEGWRLLALQGSGRARDEEPTPFDGPPPTPGGIVMGTRVELATTNQQLSALWQANTLALGETQQPTIDFDTEIVVLVADIESGSCPIRFDGIRVEADQQQIVLLQVVPDTYAVCTSDANSVIYAVALQRASLLPGPFTIAGPADLWVDVDLTVAASAVSDDATVAAPLTAATPAPLPPGFAPDPRPTAPLAPGVEVPQPAPPPAAFPLVLEPGFASTYDLPSGCFVSLGPINSYVWQIGNLLGGGGPPDEWLTTVDPSGQLRAELLLGSDAANEPQLEVTVAGLTKVYQIADGQLPTC